MVTGEVAPGRSKRVVWAVANPQGRVKNTVNGFSGHVQGAGRCQRASKLAWETTQCAKCAKGQTARRERSGRFDASRFVARLARHQECRSHGDLGVGAALLFVPRCRRHAVPDGCRGTKSAAPTGTLVWERHCCLCRDAAGMLSPTAVAAPRVPLPRGPWCGSGTAVCAAMPPACCPRRLSPQWECRSHGGRGCALLNLAFSAASVDRYGSGAGRHPVHQGPPR